MKVNIGMQNAANNFLQILSKEWRTDISLWEEKKIIFWFIPYYKYSIWKGGKVRFERTLFIKENKTKIYFQVISLPSIKVGKREFKDKYQNNKYMIPLNYELDINIP